jgi:hypothetical protein
LNWQAMQRYRRSSTKSTPIKTDGKKAMQKFLLELSKSEQKKMEKTRNEEEELDGDGGDDHYFEADVEMAEEEVS